MKSLTISKKWVAGIIAILLAMSFALVGCSGANNTSQSTDSSSANKTKLTVGFDDSYPPYGFLDDNGGYTGFDLDLAKKVCELNGWDIELKAIDWDSKDALLDSGQINCIWNGFTMEGREDKYNFSDPYMLNEQVIVVKKDSGITTNSDLAGKVVVTQAGSAALDVLEGDEKDLADTFSRLDTIADYNNAFMQLESGNVDAVACDLSIAAYQMSANPDTYVQLTTPLSSENYAVGFKKDDTGKDMAAQVTKALKTLTDNGTVKELCEKYAEYGLDYSNWEIK